MPNPCVRAAAEGMPKITRRSALAMTGFGIAAGAASVVPALAVEDPGLAAVKAMVGRHAALQVAEHAAWKAIPYDDVPDRPRVRVQVGRTLKWRDDEGNDVYEPIWAYSQDKIDQFFARQRDAELSIFGRTAERAASINAKFDARIAALKADLAALQKEEDRVLDEIGFTVAEKKAEAAGMAVREAELEILAYRATSLAEAAVLAAWATSNPDEDWSLDRDELQTLLASIAAAGGVA